MIDKDGGYQPDPIPDEDYGAGDPKVPYWIGFGVLAVVMIAMHTVAYVVPLGTTLAFLVVVIWGVTGFVISPGLTILIWIPMRRPRKWPKFWASIACGVLYWGVSAMIIALLSHN